MTKPFTARYVCIDDVLVRTDFAPAGRRGQGNADRTRSRQLRAGSRRNKRLRNVGSFCSDRRHVMAISWESDGLLTIHL